MHIVEFRWEPYSLPLSASFATARGDITERSGFVIRIRDEDGRWGIGEAAPLPHFGGETPGETRRALAAWQRSLTGAAVSLPPRIEAHSPPAFGLAEDFPAAPAARHGLELALLDLAAQRAGLPLARLLHPRAPTAVPVNATLAARECARAAGEAREAVAAGFGTLKVKVGIAGDEADESRLRAVRAAAGAGVRLRIDANGAWREAQARRLLERWADIGLEYAEQPLPAGDVAGMARLASQCPVPIAADESVRGEEDARLLLERSAAQVLVLKPMLLGGILSTLAITRMALAHGVPVVITTTLDAVYARTGALHAAAAVQALHAESPLSDAPPACGLATGSLLAWDLLPDPPSPRGGLLHLADTPGLGLPAAPSLGAAGASS